VAAATFSGTNKIDVVSVGHNSWLFLGFFYSLVRLLHKRGGPVAVPFETIKPEVVRLSNFMVGDLDYLVSHETGGNYLAAALITCACDALSYLKHGDKNRGELFFAEVIPLEWKLLAPALYEAIRNGIVHSYDTKVICVGSRKIIVNISWGAMPHFHLSADRTTIHINIRNLAADFKEAVKRFESDLKDKPDLRETFEKSMRKSREVLVQENEHVMWEQCLSRMKVAT
jgi:hypothetical protein